MAFEFISAGEAARLLGLSHAYLATLEEQGKLRPAARIDTGHKQGRAYRLADVKRLVAEREANMAAGLRPTGNGREQKTHAAAAS